MNEIVRKGWCPSLFAPMVSGDGLLVRVRPPGGVLTADAARALAGAAAGQGNGIVDLGNRASIQLRGFRAESVPAFAAAMIARGLAGPDPAAEARRAVIAPPLAGDDPAAHPDATRVARAVEDMLARETRLSALPPKFGVSVDAGGVLPIGAAPADIRVHLNGEGPHGADVSLDGADLAARGEPVETVLRLALAFLALGPARRMRSRPAGEVFRAARLTPLPVPPPSVPRATAGWLPYPGTARGAFAVGLPFGATDAATLAALADLAGEFGDGTLRVTPFRAFALPRVTDPDGLRARIERLGLIASADDPRTRIAACPGAPACASASAPIRADATRLAALALPGTLHLSGCAKGCAHPATADITLVAEAGGYAIVRHGRAGDTPDARGLSLADIETILTERPIA